MEGVEERLDAGTHLLEAGNGVVAAFYAVGVGAYLLLRSLEFEASFLYKIMDHSYLVDIGRSVEAGAVVVAPWLYLSKALFPET